MKATPVGRSALGVAAICTLAAGLWWVLLVRYHYQGNWSGLYCVGSQVTMPPELEAEGLFRVPAPAGYDGQWYHAMAHDPLMAKRWQRYMDHPAQRYPRILVPALAYVAAFGRQEWIDPAFRLVVLGFVFMGVYWLAEFAVLHGRAVWWGASFLLFPATLTSLDRMLTDGPLLALAAGFALWAARPSWQLWTILASAALTRDTGVTLAAGAFVFYASQRQIRAAALCVSSVIPLLLWYAYAGPRLPVESEPWRLTVPLAGFVAASHAVAYPYAPGLRLLFNVLDEACLAATLAALALAFLWAAKQWSPLSAAAAMLGLLALVTASGFPYGPWEEAYGYGRVFTPLLLWLCLRELATGGLWAWALTGVVSLRLLAYFATPAIEIVRGLLALR